MNSGFQKFGCVVMIKRTFMTFARVNQIVLRTVGILMLGAVFFQFAPAPSGGVLYGAESMPLTIAPFRYKIPSPPDPVSPKAPAASAPEMQPQVDQVEKSTVTPLSSEQQGGTSAASQPSEQQTDAAASMSPSDRPVSVQTTSTDKLHAAKTASAPLTQAGVIPKKTSSISVAASRPGAVRASKTGQDSHSKSEPLVPKSPAVSNPSQRILEISADLSSPSAEVIVMVLSGVFPPQTQVIEGKTPKIICDFPDVRMEKSIKPVMPVNGRYVLQVRTGIHPPPEPKSRVVIDLAPNFDYEVEQLFYEQNNRYAMIIREKP